MAPLALSIIVDAYPDPDRRATAIGIWAAAAGLGFGAGPIVGGILLALFDWSAIFWVNVPLGLATAALTLAVVRESRNPDARRLDPLGAGLAAAAMFLLTYTLIETNDHPWLSVRTLGLFAAAAALVVAFLAWERRTPHPMIELGLFRSRVFVVGSVVYGLAYLGLAGLFFFVTLYLQNVRGWSALETGLSWLWLNVPFLVVSAFAGRIGGRLGSARAGALGALLAAAGMATLAAMGIAAPFAQIVAGFVLLGLGYGLIAPVLPAATLGAVPAAHAGVASGILNASRQLAAAAGLAILGSVGVAAAARSWHGPDALLQKVAGGEVAAGHDAFMAGVHAALWTGTAVLAVAALLALRGLRRAAPR